MDRTFASAAERVRFTSSPPTVIVPESASRSQPTIVSSVDFPAPLEPMKAVIPPSGISRSTGPMTVVCPEEV